VISSRVCEAGDSALLLELDEVIDPAINAHAIAAAAVVRRAAIAGVRDVVPTYRSVAVHFDPLVTDVDALRSVLTGAVEAAIGTDEGGTIVVPVQYGGKAGPDLNAVAAFAGIAPDEVVARHAGGTYRVYMLGFLPGFAYMGSVHESIAMPRHGAPRLNVAAGSVGIAGRQTGIYPRQSPGGWQIIGRTSVRLFDTNRSPSALLAPGDSVRFEVGTGLETELETEFNSVPNSVPTSNFARFVTVVRPGLLTTIQDEGRWGQQASGVPVSGAMDLVSHRIANALIGNDASAASLEATVLGPAIRFETPTLVAVAGADLGARIDGADLPLHQPVPCRPGGVLQFGERRSGTRAYIAFGGGIVAPPALGSRSTHTQSGLGGVGGRAVAAGDRLPLGTQASGSNSRVIANPSVRVRGGARLRVLPGPQREHFPDDALDLLQRTRFTVTPQSDRMGYRLTGGTIPRIAGREMISDATFAGALQVPPSGHPILLMADRQTTGGYPQLAVVITADLPAAGQLAPGDWIEFEVCSRREAVSALMAQEGALRAVQ
jgi:antagonist of KipI